MHRPSAVCREFVVRRERLLCTLHESERRRYFLLLAGGWKDRYGVHDSSVRLHSASTRCDTGHAEGLFTAEELNCSSRTGLRCKLLHLNARVQNSLSTHRSSFAAANQVVILAARDQWMRRDASCRHNWVDLLQVSLSGQYTSAHVLWTNLDAPNKFSQLTSPAVEMCRNRSPLLCLNANVKSYTKHAITPGLMRNDMSRQLSFLSFLFFFTADDHGKR